MSTTGQTRSKSGRFATDLTRRRHPDGGFWPNQRTLLPSAVSGGSLRPTVTTAAPGAASLSPLPPPLPDLGPVQATSPEHIPRLQPGTCSAGSSWCNQRPLPRAAAPGGFHRPIATTTATGAASPSSVPPPSTARSGPDAGGLDQCGRRQAGAVAVGRTSCAPACLPPMGPMHLALRHQGWIGKTGRGGLRHCSWFQGQEALWHTPFSALLY